jgi:hypothetical protein
MHDALAFCHDEGVDKIMIDSKKEGIMTTMGGVDPMHVLEATRRKACKHADIVTISSATTVPSSPKPVEKKKPGQQPQHWDEKRYMVAAGVGRRAPAALDDGVHAPRPAAATLVAPHVQLAWCRCCLPT